MTNVLNASVPAKKSNFVVVVINNPHGYLVKELCRCFSVEVLIRSEKADLNETLTGFSTLLVIANTAIPIGSVSSL